MDDTPKVCNKYLKLFSNINIIRNKINVGGNANILRCYEESTMTYVWVLADNDLLNFDYCDDFISAIESEKYGLILCSSGNYITSNSETPSFDSEGFSELLKNNSNKLNYLENTAEELNKIIKKYYFTVTSFIPSTIYKTSLFDSNLFIESYNYISQSYPHFPLLVKALEDNVLTYNYSPGVELGSVISSDDVLAYIVELSSNAQAYKDAKAAHPEVTSVSYGNGCDLTNMGFCYNSETGEMKVVLSNQFTTYLYNYYSNGGNVPANTINDDNTKNSVDPVTVEETTGDAKNPNTGSFTEIGIIVGLLALLIIVINLKKRSETEFKI